MQRDCIARIDQRGIADQCVADALELHHFFEVAKRPTRKFLSFRHRRLVLQHGFGLFAQRILEVCEIAADAELAAVLVEHEIIHRQVRRGRIRAKRIGRHIEIELGANVARHCGRHGNIRGLGGRDKALRKLGERPKLVAQPLRDRFPERLDFFLEEARHQPIGARGADLVQ